MSAKAKPTHKMRRRDFAVATGENANGKAALYRLASGRVCKQDAERKQANRFDGGNLLPPAGTRDTARTRIANAEPLARRAD